MSIRCIIVDDEPLAQEVLESYVNDMTSLSLVATCNDAYEAMQVVNEHEVDLIFLDVNMPKLSGMSFAKSLHNAPEIIFVTAYPEYAVEGFEVEAVDYLLKPFSADRFLSAVNKVIAKINSQKTKEEQSHFMVKADKKLHRVPLNEINYFQAIGDFVKVFTVNGVLITSENLKQIERELKPFGFLRIHKSYIVPINKIQFIEGNRVKLEGEMLPIGLTYKDALMKFFQ